MSVRLQPKVLGLLFCGINHRLEMHLYIYKLVVGKTIIFTDILSFVKANKRLGFSFSRSEIARNRGPRPAVAKSPMERRFKRPVLESTVTVTISSAHR
jgi:hypothetical protein